VQKVRFVNSVVDFPASVNFNFTPGGRVVVAGPTGFPPADATPAAKGEDGYRSSRRRNAASRPPLLRILDDEAGPPVSVALTDGSDYTVPLARPQQGSAAVVAGPG